MHFLLFLHLKILGFSIFGNKIDFFTFKIINFIEKKNEIHS